MHTLKYFLGEKYSKVCTYYIHMYWVDKYILMKAMVRSYFPNQQIGPLDRPLEGHNFGIKDFASTGFCIDTKVYLPKLDGFSGFSDNSQCWNFAESYVDCSFKFLVSLSVFWAPANRSKDGMCSCRVLVFILWLNWLK